MGDYSGDAGVFVDFFIWCALILGSTLGGIMTVYIALDVEAAGSALGFHPTLSIGAAVVTRNRLTFSELDKKGLVFYGEMKPLSFEFEMEAMRVACSHLQCLDEVKQYNVEFDSNHARFNPARVLRMMNSISADPTDVFSSFQQWILTLSRGQDVVGVCDTTFFDSSHINLGFGFGLHSMSPFGWKGLDLASLYRGMTGKENAKLGESSAIGEYKGFLKHRADHDAVFLARITHHLLFERLGWQIKEPSVKKSPIFVCVDGVYQRLSWVAQRRPDILLKIICGEQDCPQNSHIRSDVAFSAFAQIGLKREQLRQMIMEHPEWGIELGVFDQQ